MRLTRFIRVVVPALVLLLHFGGMQAHTDITPGQAHEMIHSGAEVIVLDVREYSEFCGPAEHLEDAVNLPNNSGVLQARHPELPRFGTIIVHCASGGRSNVAANFLDSQGFTDVYDMVGGIGAWTWQTEPCHTEPVLRIDKSPSGLEINWIPTTGVQDYDLLRGMLGEIHDSGTFIDLGPAECLSNDSPFTQLADTDPVPAGLAEFFLVRQKNSSWGWSSDDWERSPSSAACD